MRNRLFNVVQIKKPKTNVFDLSHERKLSCNMAELVPVYLEEVVPGDRFKVNTELLVRLAPMVSPVMHRVNVYTHYFFVPNRLVYSNWETFITGGETGLETATFPRINITNANKTSFYKGTLPDYMGIPTAWAAAFAGNHYISALPFRAYQLIYNEYYRDQSLQTEIALTKNDTVLPAEEAAIIAIRNRCWEKDYFTSALPWTQRGGEVSIPGSVTYQTVTDVVKSTGLATTAGNVTTNAGGPPSQLQDAGLADLRVENIDEVQVTVNELRRSLRLQEWLEKNARAGSRYVEQILSHFGVKSSDSRIQRPEYLGGAKNPVVISEVLNTSATATEPQGNMAGHGLSVGNVNGFDKFFEEHGMVIGILSILPRTAYQQGMPKLFTKSDKFDFYWPEFANLGEQVVLNREVLNDYNAADTANDGTFGYQSRYAEYKFKNSSVHGDFTDNLSHWHMGRIFSGPTSLNAAFVSSDPTHRVFAVTDTGIDKCYVQIFNSVKAIRPMPVFGTPLL